jgi:hypothetical protein
MGVCTNFTTTIRPIEVQARPSTRDISLGGVDVFETTVQKTNIRLKDIMRELGWEDWHKAYAGLRTTLHTLRDCLTPGGDCPVRRAARGTGDGQ